MDDVERRSLTTDEIKKETSNKEHNPEEKEVTFCLKDFNGWCLQDDNFYLLQRVHKIGFS